MALFVLSLCPFDISVGVGAFVIGLSRISSFFSPKVSLWSLSEVRGNSKLYLFALDEISSGNRGISILVAVIVIS